MGANKTCAKLIEVTPLVMRTIRSEMRGLAQPELSVAQFRLLARLNYKPHSNKDLATWAGISTATMSRTMDQLVHRGLVKRELKNDNRREVVLSLTPKGKNKFQALEEKTKDQLLLRFQHLSSAELKCLDEALSLLKEVFDV